MNTPPEFISIIPEDMQGLMEVIHGLQGDSLDLILHSPGGSAEATESLVSYLRTKFKDVRVIIPHAAMSAATMLACSADKIIMGKHSFLGPIDSTFFSVTGFAPTMSESLFWAVGRICWKIFQRFPIMAR